MTDTTHQEAIAGLTIGPVHQGNIVDILRRLPLWMRLNLRVEVDMDYVNMAVLSVK